jgi:hypothetical protein
MNFRWIRSLGLCALLLLFSIATVSADTIIIEEQTQAPMTLYWVFILVFLSISIYSFQARDTSSFSDVACSGFAALIALMLMAWSFWGIEQDGTAYQSQWLGIFWLILMIYMALICVHKILDIAREEGDKVSY